MDVRHLSISEPTVRENGMVPKHYVQYLKYQNGPICFQSKLFQSNGPKVGLNKGYQLLTCLNTDTRDMLTQIENFVVMNLKLPSPIAEKWKQYSDTSGDTLPFKRLYEGQNLYIKLAHDVQLFDMDHLENGQYQCFTNQPPLGMGMYMVLIEVPAVYIGSHNTNPKVASLQLRITQIVYRPKLMGQCRIVSHLDALKPGDMDDSLDHLLENSSNPPVEAKLSRKRNSSKKNNKKKTDKPEDSIQSVIDSVVISS